MAFFEVQKEEKLTPDVRALLAVLRHRRGIDATPRDYLALAGSPPLLRAVIDGMQLLNPLPSRFGGVPFIAGMLIAHRNGCMSCFDASRAMLDKLGFDEPTLNGMCERPEQLSLPPRERRAVEFTLRVSQGDRAKLGPDDYREMERAGFFQDELFELIGLAAWWNFATTIGPAMRAGLSDG